MNKMIFITSCFYEPNVASITKRLSEKNISWFRFNTESFPLLTKIGLYCSNQNEMYATLSDGNKTVDTRQITSHWFRRFGDFLLSEGLDGYEERFARNECLATLQSVFSQMDCFWVNPRLNESQANVKVHQLQVAKAVGLSTPLTLITNQPNEARAFVENNRSATLFKPISGAAIGGQPPRYTKEVSESYSGQFALPPASPIDEPDQTHYAIFARILTPERMTQIDSIVGCPVAFQEYVEKRLELRITIIGEAVFAAEIYSQEYEATKIDWRHLSTVPDSIPTHKVHCLPDEISGKLLELMKHLGLVFGAIDMILTPEGEYVFLEINPAGQWEWIEKLTGMPITDTLTDMLIRGSV